MKIASHSDLSALEELTTELHSVYKFPEMFEDHKELILPFLNPNTLAERLILLEEDKGFVALEYIPKYAMARIAYVYIRKDFRKTGLMNEFIEAFEYWGKHIGAKKYNLATMADMSSRGYEPYEIMYMKEVK